MLNYLKNLMMSSNDQAITYEEYMNAVLYHPSLGYYMKETEKVGTKGDFITSSNISNMYGKLFAQMFTRLIEDEKIPPVVCEVGGGNGRFARAVLDEWNRISPETFKYLQYIMIEASPFHRSLQASILPVGEKVTQLSSLSEAVKKFPSFNGIVFSNELFDALPVRVIEKRNNELFEVKIRLTEKNILVETLLPLDDDQIITYLEETNIQLQNGQRFEVPLIMTDFLTELGEFVERGIVFTVDYGYTNEEWMEPAHRRGSLRGYYKHQLIEDVLVNPGEMDITTHIHFDTLLAKGIELGFDFVTKLRQDEFLLSAGILEYLEDHYDSNPFSEVSKQNRAIRSLIMGGGISSAFHVIVQQKGVSVGWDKILKKYK